MSRFNTPLYCHYTMDKVPDEDSIESRLRKTLDKLDDASKKAAKSTKKGIESVKKKVKGTSESIDTKDLMEKTQKGISKMNARISAAARDAEVGTKMGKLGTLATKAGEKLIVFFGLLLGYLPYLIPATIIFQSAVWVAFLVEDSTSNAIVAPFVEGISQSSQMIWVVLTLFGAASGYLLTLNFDSSGSPIEVLELAQVYDAIVVLLLISSILYLLRDSRSLYYLSLAFGGSVVIRLIETSIFNYNWLLIIFTVIGLIGYFSAISLPFIRSRISSEKDSEGPEIYNSIDIGDILSHDTGEASYLTLPLLGMDLNMEDAPIHPPKRPTRRSEYELYEWVCLMANFILWPTTLAVALLLGSGVEMYGSSFTMDDNSMMLYGPLVMTAFFFVMLYRMDANARDGSLYAAQKQAYLDEMEKFVEAKKAYLELVTLQAEIKKQQLLEENPNLTPVTSEN